MNYLIVNGIIVFSDRHLTKCHERAQDFAERLPGYNAVAKRMQTETTATYNLFHDYWPVTLTFQYYEA